MLILMILLYADFDKMDGHFEKRKKREMEMRDPVLNQLQGLVQTFQDTADRLTGTESNLEVLMRKQISDVMVKYVSFHFCLCSYGR